MFDGEHEKSRTFQYVHFGVERVGDVFDVLAREED